MDLDPKILSELLNVFRGEFLEQEQQLAEALLALESENEPHVVADYIALIFRIAHTIKGSSRSVGLDEVGLIAHEMEDAFSLYRDSESKPSPDDIDRFLKMLAKMKELVEAHVVGGKDVRNTTQSDASKAVDVNSGDISENESVLQASLRVDIDKIEKMNALADDVQSNKYFVADCERLCADLHKKISGLNENIKDTGFGVEATHALNEISKDAMALQKNVGRASRSIGFIAEALQDSVRSMRLVPISTITTVLTRDGRDIARELGKKIKITVDGESVQIDRAVLDLAKPALMHLLRNAIDHGIESPEMRIKNGKFESGEINLHIIQQGDSVVIKMSDDGRGIDLDRIEQVALNNKLLLKDEFDRLTEYDKKRLIFDPGFTTKDMITDISGRGVGLDVVKSNMTAINGDVDVDSVLHKGSIFTLTLPLTMLSDRAVFVKDIEEIFALPTHSVERILKVKKQDLIEIENGLAIKMDDEVVLLRSLSSVLKLNKVIDQNADAIEVVVVSSGWKKMAFYVDEVLGERDVVVKSLSDPVDSIRHVSGATITTRGDVIIVLEPRELIDSAFKAKSEDALFNDSDFNCEYESQRILVVDDSITTRTLETNILTIQGYDVTSCVDGLDAWNMLQDNDFDLVVTDVEMPNMNGFELSEKIRTKHSNPDIPIIMVTSLSKDEDKEKGIDIGVNAYIVKKQFETQSLVDAIARLI